MQKMALLLSTLGLLSLGSAANAQQRPREHQLATILAGRKAGRPVDCVDLSRVSSTQIVPGTAIVYHLNDGTILVNRPHDPGLLDLDNVLVTETATTQVCNVDTVRLVASSSHMPVGSVGLGMFVPYSKKIGSR